MSKKKITKRRICYVGTIYALLLYLLHSNYEEINSTYFLFAYGIPEDICKRFDNYKIMYGKAYKLNFLQKVLSNFRYTRWINNFFVRCALFIKMRGSYLLYVQDHLQYSNAIIGSHDYILIEDSKYIFSRVYSNESYLKIWEKKDKNDYVMWSLLYGKSLYGIFGKNSCCHSVLLSAVDECEHLKHKHLITCNLKDAWHNISSRQRNYINYIFDFCKDDFLFFENSDVLFTQCFYPYLLNKQEHYLLYKKILDDFPNRKVIIKTHPRDTFPYLDYFPDNCVCDKIIPMQLISLNGIKIHNCATVYSSAVNDVECKGDLFWYGTEINIKIFNFAGHVDAPIGAKVLV